MGGFSDIGAHQFFEKANFFMPQLLLRELWVSSGLVKTEPKGSYKENAKKRIT